MNSYASLCDDFGVNMFLTGKTDLPSGRETVLHFFDTVKKLYPTMTDFEKRDANEYVLEEPRERGNYRWAGIDGKRFNTGSVNPETLEMADDFNRKMLELIPYHLDVHPLDTEQLDVQYYFDLNFQGNHDEAVTEALLSEGPLESFARQSGAKLLNFQPNIMIALDDNCQFQARLNVETRTNAYHVRTGTFPDTPITVYLTVRQYWGRQPFANYWDSYQNQRAKLDELAADHVIPKIINPLQRAISGKS